MDFHQLEQVEKKIRQLETVKEKNSTGTCDCCSRHQGCAFELTLLQLSAHSPVVLHRAQSLGLSCFLYLWPLGSIFKRYKLSFILSQMTFKYIW